MNILFFKLPILTIRVSSSSSPYSFSQRFRLPLFVRIFFKKIQLRIMGDKGERKWRGMESSVTGHWRNVEWMNEKEFREPTMSRPDRMRREREKTQSNPVSGGSFWWCMLRLVLAIFHSRYFLLLSPSPFSFHLIISRFCLTSSFYSFLSMTTSRSDANVD